MASKKSSSKSSKSSIENKVEISIKSNTSIAFKTSPKSHLKAAGLSLAKCKKIIIITGAGVSVSAGIPDFRSSNGLYNIVKQKFPGVVFKGQELFDASLFKDEIKKKMFYHFIAGLKKKSADAKATPTHQWFKELHEMGSLGRVYTQNIDDLDRKSGLDVGFEKTSHVVQLHGDLDTVKCTLCSHSQEFDDAIVDQFYEGEWPPCPSCTVYYEDRIKNGRRGVAVGFLRPAIVLYNEHHGKGDAIADIQGYDLARKADGLIVIGTSLKIHGLKSLIKSFADVVRSKKGPCIFMNLSAPSNEWNDVFDTVLLGPCDDSVAVLSQVMKGEKEAELEKKKQKELAKEKKAEKERRQSAATSDIRKFFQVAKKETPATTASKPAPKKSDSKPLVKIHSDSTVSLSDSSSNEAPVPKKTVKSPVKNKVVPKKKASNPKPLSSNTKLNADSSTASSKSSKSVAPAAEATRIEC